MPPCQPQSSGSRLKNWTWSMLLNSFHFITWYQISMSSATKSSTCLSGAKPDKGVRSAACTEEPTTHGANQSSVTEILPSCPCGAGTSRRSHWDIRAGRTNRCMECKFRQSCLPWPFCCSDAGQSPSPVGSSHVWATTFPPCTLISFFCWLGKFQMVASTSLSSNVEQS